ncbi:MAG: CsbD family protein [Pseudomonadota bacterium]|nr:CsbD family protein [Pseudomonadota bacterium]
MEQVKGSIQDIAAKVQDAVGSATGDAGLQAEAKTRQATGKMQQTFGESLDVLRDAASGNPLATLAAAAGI